MRGQREVIKRLRVVLSRHTHTRDVHRPQVELRVRRPTLGGAREVLHRRRGVFLHAVSGEVHVAKPIESEGVIIRLHRLPEEFERRGVVLRGTQSVRMHVSKVRGRVCIALRRRAAEVLQRARVVALDAVPAEVEKLADGGLRSSIAQVGSIHVVLDHLRARSPPALLRLSRQAHFISAARRTWCAPHLDHSLRDRLVVQHRCVALLRRPPTDAVPEAHGHLCIDIACRRCKVKVDPCTRNVRAAGRRPRGIHESYLCLRTRIAFGSGGRVERVCALHINGVAGETVVVDVCELACRRGAACVRGLLEDCDRLRRPLPAPELAVHVLVADRLCACEERVGVAAFRGGG
mmetsp:Transcript_6673/g.27220  ORF Transcript_6673/g.27220 Transcript_6673/m.27220 type:complete len:348 (-) Transcript_6673:132-1175(-)